MASLNRNEKVTCDNCVTQTRKLNLASHKKRCPAGKLCCIQYPNFSTESPDDLHFQIAKKHSAPKNDVTFQCKICYQQFWGFYVLRQHKHTQHGVRIRKANPDFASILNEVEDANLEEELRSCQHFLVNSALERVRHEVSNSPTTQWKIPTYQ